MTRRRPVRWRTWRPSRRQQQRDAQLLAYAVVTAAGIGLVVMVFNWLLAHWWVLVVVLVLAAWASGSRPLWELLRAEPPPRRPTSLS